MTEARVFSINRADVVSEIIDGEVVIINLASGKYYGLGGSGAEIWTAIEQGSTAAEIVDGVCSAYHGPREEIVRDVVSLLAELRTEELIILPPGSAESDPVQSLNSGVPGTGPNPYSAPTLEAFTDMQEFLLVDPIHEVDERGFPKPSTPKGPMGNG
ncbi:PqqD family protein [Gemmatimonadota bacterium]